MVGVALPYSIASRIARGQGFSRMLSHAVVRSLILIFLGIFLRSVGRPQTNFTFEDTLTQIGLGYPFLFLLGFASSRNQWVSLGVLLAGYWALFALYPLPGPNFDWQRVGVPPDWLHHLTGFAQHWDKNSNPAAAFDQWFLNLFPRQKPFVYNGGGYATLSFIPTLGTMIFGLIAGRWLRTDRPAAAKLSQLLFAGAVCLIVGLVLHWLGVCPIVKRIWTPSWTIYSAGWAFLLLGFFYGIIDWKEYRSWAFPLVVVGMNSIAMYCLVHLIDRFLIDSFKTHLGRDFFRFFGETFEPLLSGAAALLVLWLLLYWMYRRKLFLRI
jgi:predicted acyltransferase